MQGCCGIFPWAVIMEASFLKNVNYEDPTTKLGLANIYHTQLQSIVIRIDFSDKKKVAELAR